MQMPSMKLNLLTMVKTGIPGRELVQYQTGREITGSIYALSKEDYTKRYGSDDYVDNGAYALNTRDVLNIGSMVQYQGKRYRVIGFQEGRFRNSVHLIEVNNE